MDVTDESEADYWTQDEVIERLAAMSEADLFRIRLVSEKLAYGDLSPEDLQQEAFRRAIETNKPRRWPKHISLVVFVIQSMKSIQSSAGNSAAHQREVNEAEGGALLSTASNSSAPCFESRMHDEDEARALKEEVLATFEGDAVAQEVLEGMMAELRGQELCELVGIDAQELATVRRRIQRGLATAFPKGWRSND